MQTITQTLRTVAAMAMILAGFALASGWLSVAMAGGGKWSRLRASENERPTRGAPPAPPSRTGDMTAIAIVRKLTEALGLTPRASEARASTVGNRSRRSACPQAALSSGMLLLLPPMAR